MNIATVKFEEIEELLISYDPLSSACQEDFTLKFPFGFSDGWPSCILRTNDQAGVKMEMERLRIVLKQQEMAFC